MVHDFLSLPSPYNLPRRREEGVALQAVAHMEQGRVIPLDSTLAIEAAVYGPRHKLPLADSIIYATARKYGATLWTRDADFKGPEGVRYYPWERARDLNEQSTLLQSTSRASQPRQWHKMLHAV